MDEKARPLWNAEPRHDWPDGDYVGATCSACGVRGFHHPKRAPAYCWPHWQEAQREAEWRRAKWESDMCAEYGPYTPKPRPFERAMLAAAGARDDNKQAVCDNPSAGDCNSVQSVSPSRPLAAAGGQG